MIGIVVSCFDYSGVMVQPWLEAGYTCYIVDIQHEKGEHRKGNLIRVGADIFEWEPPKKEEIAFASFFPPCTDLAVSGARWFKQKGLYALSDAIRLFARSVELAQSFDCPAIIENPVSTISTYWREPDYLFDPCEYADYLDTNEQKMEEAYTKRTCLWTSESFVMPPKKGVVPVHGSMMHKLPPSEERANLRSKTPAGFARAVHLFNDPKIKSIKSK